MSDGVLEKDCEVEIEWVYPESGCCIKDWDWTDDDGLTLRWQRWFISSRL